MKTLSSSNLSNIVGFFGDKRRIVFEGVMQDFEFGRDKLETWGGAGVVWKICLPFVAVDFEEKRFCNEFGGQPPGAS